MSEIKILDQDATNAAIAAAMQQMKDYVDSKRTDLPVTASAAASFDTEVTTAAQAIALRDRDLTDFVDDLTETTNDFAMFRKVEKLTTVRFTKLKNLDFDLCGLYMLEECPMLVSAMFDKLQSITVTNAMRQYNRFLYNCANLVSAVFPSLTTITCSGGYTSSVNYNQFLSVCTSLVTASFPVLKSVTCTGSGSADNVNDFLYNCTSLVIANFPALTSLRCTGSTGSNTNNFLQNCTSLTTFDAPKLVSITFPSSGTRNQNMLRNCTSLTSVKIGTEATALITALDTTTPVANMHMFEGSVDLIDVEIGNHLTDQPEFDAVSGPKIKQNLTLLCKWVPTNVLSDAAKCAQWNANIRDHIAANCVDGSYTVTFNSALNGTDYLEAATIQAFTSKGWTVAYA